MKIREAMESHLHRLGELRCAGCGKVIAKVPMDTYEMETWLCDGCAGIVGYAPVTEAMRKRWRNR